MQARMGVARGLRLQMAQAVQATRAAAGCISKPALQARK